MLPRSRTCGGAAVRSVGGVSGLVAALAHVSNVSRIGGIATGGDVHAAFIVPHRFVRIVARHAIYQARVRRGVCNAGVRRPAEFIPFHVVIRELHDGVGPAGRDGGYVDRDAEQIQGTTRTDPGATRTAKIAGGMAVRAQRLIGGDLHPSLEIIPRTVAILALHAVHRNAAVGTTAVRPTTLDPCCVPGCAIHRDIRCWIWIRTGYGAISGGVIETGCIMAAVAVGRHGHRPRGLVQDPVLREQVTIPTIWLARTRIEVAHDVFHVGPGHRSRSRGLWRQGMYADRSETEQGRVRRCTSRVYLHPRVPVLHVVVILVPTVPRGTARPMTVCTCTVIVAHVRLGAGVAA